MEYLLNINVHAVAGLKFADPEMKETVPNPYAEVLAFDLSRITTKASNTSSAEFDAFFSFAKTIDVEEFKESDVCITVWHTYMGGMRTMKMGSITFGMERVHANPDHMVRKDWFPLALPEAPSSPVGFVQLTLGMYGPGDAVPRQAANLLDADNVAGALLPLKARVVELPNADATNIYQLHLCVHQASNLREVEGKFAKGCNPYVEVTFNGTKTETTKLKDTTSPLWNEEITVPFNFPAWDDSIGLRLVSEASMTLPEEEIGDLSFSTAALISKLLNPSWFNFYHSPQIAELGGITSSKGAECEYAGRLMVSAKVIRCENPQLGCNPTRPPREPQVTNHAMWFDFYEIAMDTGDENKLDVKVLFPPFVDEIELVSPYRVQGSTTFTWDGMAGRLDPVPVQIPEISQCADVFISLFLADQKYGYIRVPAEDILNAEHVPKWHEIFAVEAGEFASNVGVMLCSISLHPLDLGRTVPPRMTIELEEYVFRAMIYQVVNLPVADDIGKSDAFAVIFFGPVLLQTPIYSDALSPSWYLCLEKTVHMPKLETMRPNITVIVLDKDVSGIEALAAATYETQEHGNLPVVWDKPPIWLELDDVPGGPLTQARCLCAFELFPERQRSHYERDSIMPPTTPCRVEFFIIGIRMYSTAELHSPMIEANWGRADKDNPHIWANPKKSRMTKIGKGAHGQYNFFDKLVLGPCGLVSDSTYQEFLEVRIMCTEDENSEEWKPHCSANIHLTPYMPMFTEAQRSAAAKKHRTKRVSEIKREEADEERGIVREDSEDELEYEENAQGSDETKREAIARVLGWNYTEIEESNKKELDDGSFEFDCVADEHFKIFAAGQARADKIVEELKNAKDKNEDVSWMRLQLFDGTFQWPAIVTHDDGCGQHMDINMELEQYTTLSTDKLPYIISPLFRGKNGCQETVGVIKFMIRIIERDRYKENDADMQRENAEFQAKIDRFKKAYDEANDIHVRAYVLNCEGLSPNSPYSCASYLWSTCGTESDPTANIKDELQLREHTLFPHFNALHQFKRCAFPECSQIKVRVVEQVPGLIPGTPPTHEIIGHTTIDLEDRWFHPRFNKMVTTGVTPIEARRLVKEGSGFARGYIRMWVDMISAQDAQDFPALVLPDASPQEFELRIAIYKVTDIQTLDGGLACAQVVAKTSLDDGTVLKQITDQHKCSDDIATFNWRFIFNIMIPCKEPRVKFMLEDAGMMSTDMLAEVTLDFSADYTEATEGAEVILPKGKVKLVHLAFPGQTRAVLEMEGKLLSKAEATQRKVGLGRDEPNEDPFLDPQDPHLLKGREGMMAAMANAVAAVGNGLAMLGKLGAYYKIFMMIAAIIPSIGGTIFMIIQMTRSG
eukprot:TRINITY_DN55405_c0_g1_i1.p1 TRINITY_DN55405_c0_g1~~TRINITY_DN55405_c0_g1_i1.p1  ORF type:complete len:1356 (-),score=179.29 TRINITY_DN55405_c0_g1_i1:30-4097(-)